MRVGTSKFGSVYLTDPTDLVVMIRKGLAPIELERTSKAMRRTNDYVCRILKFDPATAKRKLKKDEALSPDQSERLIGLQRLIGQVETMVEESGPDDPSFDAGSWIADWLDEALPALGNRKPADFMDTRTGQELVANLLAQMQSCAYA